MVLLGIPDLSQTPASNVDFAGTSILGTGLVSTADDSFRNLASFLARWRDDLGGASTTAGTNTITVTSNEAFTAYAAGQRFMFKLGGTNTGAATLNITPSSGSALGAKNIKIVSTGTARDPIAGELVSGNYAEFQYDGTNMNLLSQAGGTASNLLSNDPFYNLTLSASVGASALTIAIKGQDGNDPSSTNPVIVNFRSATSTSGLQAQLTLTAATSLVVSSGSTLGTSSGIAAILAVVGFNDAGTFRLGVINPQALPMGIASSTAEGGVGGADSSGVFYTGTAVSSKAYTKLGTITITEATAGTWASGPTTVLVANNQPNIAAVRRQVITSTGTYTPDPNMIYCFAQLQAAGGGGGGASTSAAQNDGSTGGGAGGYAEKIFSAGVIGASQTVTLGAAGGGGAAGVSGGSASNSSFGALLTANGGAAGAHIGNISNTISTVAGPGGVGGTAASGDVNIQGQAGGGVVYPANSVGTLSGCGGNSVLGRGGQSTNGAAGIASTGYGGGGGGASCASAANFAGAAGGAAICIITEFCSA